MAKGKEGLAALQRRYEAAMEHLDRVTTEMAELKIRTRQVEGAAARVPNLEADNERLRQENEANTSYLLERERSAWQKERMELQAALDRIAEILCEALDRESEFLETHPEVSTFFNVSNHAEMAQLLGPKYTEGSTRLNRGTRRTKLAKTGAGEISRLSDEELRAAGVMRVGQKHIRVVDKERWDKATVRHTPHPSSESSSETSEEASPPA